MTTIPDFELGSYFSVEAKGGTEFFAPLEGIVLGFIPRFNYTTELWSLDVLDADGEVLIGGIMVIPNRDLFGPYRELKKTIGSLICLEQEVGDHKKVDKFESNVYFVWFPPEVEVDL